jgi:hypothetical protein
VRERSLRRRQATGPEGDYHDSECGQHFDGPAHQDSRGDERDEDRTRYLIEPRAGPLGEVEPAREPESACARGVGRKRHQDDREQGVGINVVECTRVELDQFSSELEDISSLSR